MKLNSLELMSRLSRIHDQQAGEAVKQQRSTVDQFRAQARMLRDYRRKLSLSHTTSHERTGQALRARGAFIAVAESATVEVEEQLESSEAVLKEALSNWAETRERLRTLEDKYQSARRERGRELEKKSEKDLPTNQRRKP